MIKPTSEYTDDILKFRREIFASNDNDKFAGCYNLEEYSSVDKWIKAINMIESIETCPKDKVPANVYIAVRSSDNRIVGMIDLRHHINHPILSLWGGHIGYSVRPDERKKGYGKEMLRQILHNCKQYGLNKVLITCDEDNFASEKIILANGGVFEHNVCVDGVKIKRYWIDLSDK